MELPTDLPFQLKEKPKTRNSSRFCFPAPRDPLAPKHQQRYHSSPMGQNTADLAFQPQEIPAAFTFFIFDYYVGWRHAT